MGRQHPVIHLWAPGMFDFKGGIQTYSRFLLTALRAVLPQAKVRVSLLHERTSPPAIDNNTVIQMAGTVSPRWRSSLFSAQIIAAALWDRPDLVIATHVNYTPVARWLRQGLGIPYWVVAHGFETWELETPQAAWGLRGANKILAVSQYTRDRIQQAQDLDTLSLLPNTFDWERFQIAPKPARLLERYGLQADQPIILTVNRLASHETFHPYDQVLAALPSLRQELPTVHYIIVGKGDDRARLEALIADKQLQDCVTLAGFIADDDLPAHYALCDVYAMPSKLEGFGIVYLEAMACGKPVVAGLDGGQDALLQGQLGALVDPENIAKVTQVLQEILRGEYPNPLMYQPAALRRAVLEAFGPEAFQRKLQAHLAQAKIA